MALQWTLGASPKHHLNEKLYSIKWKGVLEKGDVLYCPLLWEGEMAKDVPPRWDSSLVQQCFFNIFIKKITNIIYPIRCHLIFGHPHKYLKLVLPSSHFQKLVQHSWRKSNLSKEGLIKNFLVGSIFQERLEGSIKVG